MMGRQHKRGFTIIELILVLAISGAMLAGIIAAAGASITVQRYKDSVNSAVDYFQGQYNLVTNVRNDRNTPVGCEGSEGTTRGQSDCMIVGRVVRGEGDTVMSQAIYATNAPSSEASGTFEEISTSGIKESADESSADTYTLEWGAKFRNSAAGSATDRFAIAIVRSPKSGLVTTFVNNTGSTMPLGEIVTLPNMKTDAKLCVLPDGGIANVASEGLGVMITKGASNTSGVKQINAGEGC